ncbi:MAG: F0F1 ATP synthase subunit delta [Bacilli bacterium]|nr:F0F1 ATP synthase subunit delta [Bacilli bacterium]
MEDLYSRYASALISIAEDENKIEQYKDAMTSIFVLFNDDENILKYLGSYFVNSDDKYKLIDEMLKTFELANLNNFFKLIVNKHLIIHFKDIYLSFNKLANELLDIEEGIIYSTIKLNEDEINKISEALTKRTSKKVELKNKIDESLIGGVKIVIKDRVYDSSIKYKLEQLKSSLIKKGA